ncbi:MAG: MFS transporter [Alphaproteobacteria bacterium]
MNDPLIDSRTAWVIAAAQVGLITMAMGSTYLLWVGLKPIALDFGWPREVPSLASALQMIGTGLGGIAMGRWFDRAGLGGPLVAGALALGGGAILTFFIDAAWQLHAINFLLIGFIGIGAMFAPLLTNTTRWFERRRGLAVAVVASGQGLAGAIWPPVFRLGIDTIGWRETYLVYGLVSLAVMLPLIPAVVRRAPAISAQQLLSAQGSGTAVAGMPRHVPHALMSAGILTCCVAMAVPLVHIVAHVSDLGFGPARGAELLAFILALSFISRIAIGWFADRVGAFVSLLIGSGLQAAGLAVFALADGLGGLFLAALLFGSGFGGLIPCYAVAARALYRPADVGWRIGVIYFAGSIGMAVGGWVAGVLFDQHGSYAIAFQFALAFNLVNLAVLAVLAGAVRRARSLTPSVAPGPGGAP